MSRIIEITSKSQLDDLIAGGKKLLVDFKANWCGPCKMLHPVLEELATKETHLEIAQIDVDQNPDLASAYNILSIPSLKLFENGKMIKESAGFMPLVRLESWIK